MKFLTALLLCLLAGNASSESCTRRVLTPAELMTIDVEVNKNVHLVFAEPILRPVIGNEKEWEQFGDPTLPLHLWVSPRSTSPATAQTSFTVVTAAGAYDFVLRRVEKGGQLCVHFGTPNNIGTLSMQAPTMPNARPSAEPHDAAFVSQTQYRWKGNEIARVADDGLYTYITLTKVPRSLPTVLGEGAPVTTDYDNATRTYRIAGLFDQLTIVKGRKKIQIKRAS